MKLASYLRRGRAGLGSVEGDYLRPLEGQAPLGPDTDFAALAAAPRSAARVALVDLQLLPVVPRPAKILCLGLNYREHAAETGHEAPSHPVVFSKFADSLTAPFGPIVKPPESSEVDFEAELGVVIGRPGRRVRPADALDLVAGYTVANDVSMRDFQRRGGQWLPGKTWPRTTPVGPCMVSGEEIDHARDLEIRLTVNGTEMQRSRTSRMIFDVAETIAAISRFTPLGPGDLILMGTPEGIGARREPPTFMRAGDRIRAEIEGIGAIENEVVDEVV